MINWRCERMISHEENIQNIKDDLIEFWEQIKEMCNSVHEVITRLEKEEKLRSRWHVPIKCKLPQAPYVYNYKLQLARSNL